MPYKRVNAGLLLFFSCFFPPGANYMYMGLIKRGLAAMCGFFMLIYLMISSPMTLLFALGIPIFWITCFFDGFGIRRRINAGEEVEDGVGEILNGILRNKTLAVVLLIIIGLAFAGSILGFAASLIRRVLPALLVIFALYVIFRKKKTDEAQ